VRLAHYPYDEHLLRAADEMGLLAWSEIPTWQNIAWTAPGTYTNAQAQLSEEIVAYRNHASVIIWSVGNETTLSPGRDAFLTKLVARARQLDPSRLISAALAVEEPLYLDHAVPSLMANIVLDHAAARDRAMALLTQMLGHAPGPAQLEELRRGAVLPVEDDIAEQFDVIAINEYFGWFFPALAAPHLGIDEPTLRRAENAEMVHFTLDPKIDRPLIVSEFGADTVAGFRGPEDTVYTEDYQAALYRRQFAMLANSHNLVGMSPWVLMDLPSLMRTKGFTNIMGLADERGHRKRAFEVLRAYYAALGDDFPNARRRVPPAVAAHP
jgi:beta-glucuronidase